MCPVLELPVWKAFNQPSARRILVIMEILDIEPSGLPGCCGWYSKRGPSRE